MSDHPDYSPTTYLDIPDRVVFHNAHLLAARDKSKWRAVPLWAFVRDLCGVGSTSATEICASLGWDPHQDASKPVPPPYDTHRS